MRRNVRPLQGALQGAFFGSALSTLVDLPEALTNLTSLEDLSIAGHGVTKLPASFGNLTSLKDLSIKGHGITELPSSFSRLTLLTTLKLECDGLVELPALFGDLTSLVTLDMTCANITELPSSIGGLQSLKSLMLTCGSLTQLPSPFPLLPSLARLEIRSTRLSELPPDFNLPKLRELALICPKLRQGGAIEDIFTNYRLPLLEHLTLCSRSADFACVYVIRPALMRLTLQLPALTDLVLEKCDNLGWLSLEGCAKLTRLPPVVSRLQSLRVLDLGGCVELQLVPDLRECPLRYLCLRDCANLASLPRMSTSMFSRKSTSMLSREKIYVVTYGCTKLDRSADSTLDAVLVAAALLATLGYSSLTNPTDWDEGLGNPVVGDDTVQVHGNAPQRWLVGYFICSQVSFYGSIAAILWCLLSVWLNASARGMVKRGGDLARPMLSMASFFLGVAIAAILGAYFCAGMTSVSAQDNWSLIVVAPAIVWIVVFVVSGGVFIWRTAAEATAPPEFDGFRW
jgi:hypothetical protein